MKVQLKSREDIVMGKGTWLLINNNAEHEDHDGTLHEDLIGKIINVYPDTYRDILWYRRKDGRKINIYPWMIKHTIKPTPITIEEILNEWK